jgi:hypothetical protein
MSSEESTPVEPPQIDKLLREALGASPPPVLSPAFESRLARRLQPRGLTRTGRLVMAGYAMAALILCVWVMRSAAFDWGGIALAITAPLAAVSAVQRLRRGHAPAR